MKERKEVKPSKGVHIAIIGTGPVSLLKALFHIESNPANSVTLFDQAGQIGGAWYSDRSPKGHEIECGCHIWSYVPAAYRFIEKALGVPLYPMKPSPVFTGGPVNIPYSVKNTLDSYKTLFKMVAGLRWGKIGSLKTDPNISFRIIGKKNKYPKTGSPELIHAIEKKLGGLEQVKIFLNTHIDAVQVNERVQIVTNGNVHAFDRVYMTYLSQVNEVSVNGDRIETEAKQIDYIHFLVRLDRPPRKKISYWRLMNDEIVHRVTDVSYQAKNEEYLLLVGIKGKAYHMRSEEELMKKIQDLLIQHGLIDEQHHCEKIKTHLFPAHYLSEPSLQKLLEHKDKIKLLHTTDLMHGIYFLLQDENRL